MFNEKVMKAAATELFTVLELDTPVNPKAKLPELTKYVTEAVELLDPAKDSPDSFTEETLEVIADINPDAFPEPEEEVKPVKKGLAKKAAPVEEPDEEEEVAEKIHQKNIASKPVRTPKIEEEPKEEPEEDEKPKKPAGKKATPFVKMAFSRGDAICEILQTVKVKTKEDLIIKSDALFVKKGGQSNIKETRFASKYILPALEKFEIEGIPTS